MASLVALKRAVAPFQTASSRLHLSRCLSLSQAPRAGDTKTGHPEVSKVEVQDRWNSGRPRVVEAIATSSGVEVEFADATRFKFHNMWLRDSCRDTSHVQHSSERVLDASPLIGGMQTADIKALHVQEDGSLEVDWAEGVVPTSNFDPSFLRAYADVAGKPLESPSEAAAPVDDFFDYLDGNKTPRGKSREELNLWKNDGEFKIPRFDYNTLTENQLEFMRSVMDPGVVIVENMPEDETYDGMVLEDFAHKHLGGLQKHPLRETAHWTISTESSVHDASNLLDNEDDRKGANSYNTDQQLCNHTDQSLYGTPGLLLGFHCAFGQGNNSLTDGFAVAYALKDRYPEHWETLTTMGMNAGRRLMYYAANDLMFTTSHPVLWSDADENLMRVQFHEIYRTPLTLDFDEFPKFWEALRCFYGLVHSPEFQTHLTLQAGQLLLMNNWRTMHGRAGLKGKARTILGGTVTRESFYSRMRLAQQEKHAIDTRLECGLPTKLYKHLHNSKSV